jgi:hypothetical protein
MAIAGADSVISGAGITTAALDVNGNVPSYELGNTPEAQTGGSNTLAAAGNAGLQTIMPDAVGPYGVVNPQTIPAFTEQPYGVFLPNGNIAVFQRITANGSDTTGQGNIWLTVTDKQGNVVVPAVQVATDTNATPLDCRYCQAMILSDGRLVMVFATNVAAGGNPNGMNGGTGGTQAAAVNPDGLIGNNRYIITTGPPVGNVINWQGGATPTQHTIVTGFSSSLGFDYVGTHCPQEVQTGQLILPIVGSNTSLVFSASADVVGYLTGSFSPLGAITWNPLTAGTTVPALANHTTGEISIVPINLAGWTPAGGNSLKAGYAIPSWTNATGFCALYRDSASNQVVQSIGTGTVANLLAGTVAWAAATVLANVGTYCYADPCQLSHPSGDIYFMSRASALYPPQLVADKQGVVCSGNPAATAWTMQDLDDDPTVSFGSWYYGNLLLVPNEPNLILAVYGVNIGGGVSQCRYRYLVRGSGNTPMGSVGGTAGFFGALKADSGQIGQLVVPGAQSGIATPSGVNPFTFLHRAGGTGLEFASSPVLYGTSAAQRDYAELPTSYGSLWQNMPISGRVDSNSSLVAYNAGAAFIPATGTLYLVKIFPVVNLAGTVVRIETGAGVVAAITASYVGFYRSGLTLIEGSASVVPTASTLTAYTVASVAFGLGAIYLGILFVGTTAPSWMGAPVTLAASTPTPSLLSSSSVGQATLPATAAALTPIAGVVPWVSFATS